MGWGWYLQNDMQLFIYSIFMMLIYQSKPILAKILICLSMIGSLLFTFFWCYNQKMHVLTHLNDFSNWGDFFTDLYIKPWARCPPYLFGLLLGIFYS